MFYSFSIILFLISIHYFFIHFSNALPSEEDRMLIAFMRNDQKMKISEYSMQKYEAHLGILYYMRKNWKCNKIAKEFEEYERKKCQKYRKFLDILYEYFYREYARIPTVKPKFILKKQIEIDEPIIYVVNCLVNISKFYFISYSNEYYKYKLNNLFICHFEPKLLNEKRLNYDQKLPINEMILQLAIDTANEWQTNENLYEIIRPNFDKNLGKIFQKAEKRIKLKHSDYDKHDIIIFSKFDDQWNWTDDALFTEFVKGSATNFEKFFKMAKEYSNYIYRNKEKRNFYCYENILMISSGLYKYEKMKKYLMKKYEDHLGTLYLMRENWHCETIKNKHKAKCQKHRRYLHLLYEYLFRLYVEGKNPELANKSSAVKPLCIEYANHLAKLIKVIGALNDMSKYFWKNSKFIWRNKKYYREMVWLNEVELNYEIQEDKELNYEIKEEENWISKFKQNLFERKKVQTKANEILNSSNEFENNLRQEFEQKMGKIYENAKEEKAKFQKAIKNAANDKERRKLKYEYAFGIFTSPQFGIINSSPFSFANANHFKFQQLTDPIKSLLKSAFFMHGFQMNWHFKSFMNKFF